MLIEKNISTVADISLQICQINITEITGFQMLFLLFGCVLVQFHSIINFYLIEFFVFMNFYYLWDFNESMGTGIVTQLWNSIDFLFSFSSRKKWENLDKQIKRKGNIFIFIFV